MKRILLGLAIVAGLAFGGPQVLSNAVHQMGGPQLLSGQAQAAYVCRWYARRVYAGRRCYNYYRNYRYRRCGYYYGRYYCRWFVRRVYAGRRCVNYYRTHRYRRCFHY